MIPMATARPGDPGFQPYANGVTYVPYCIDDRRDGICGDAATEMVGPLSLCAKHAEAERVERARHDEFVRAYSETPEAKAAAAAERRLEGRVS